MKDSYTPQMTFHELTAKRFFAVLARIKLMQTNTFILTILLMFCSLAVQAGNTLKDVSISSLPGEKVLITFTLDKKADKPISFTIDNPARIAMDFKGTKNRIKKRKHMIGLGHAESLYMLESGGRTRAIINLSKLTSYQTRVDGNRVHVTLGNGYMKPKIIKQDFAKNATTDKNAPRIHDIDFRRGIKGQGKIIIKLDNRASNVDIRKQGNKIVADFLNTSLANGMERRLDVVDFATPVKSIDTFRQGDHVRMIVSPEGKFEHIAYQSQNSYVIEVKPVKKKMIQRSSGISGNYKGDRLTLNFQNIQVRAVLQLLADFTSLNIVVSDTVKGGLTLRLKNVPWDQALDIILKTKGLAMRREGNVLRVAPAAEIAAIEQQELSNFQKTQRLAPVVTEWFQINYANANEILGTLSSKSVSLLSKRGKAVVDKRTNSLMVQDTATNITEIRNLIKRLDIPVRQVLIESRIVIANNDFTRDLGVKFSLNSTNAINSGRDFVSAGGPSQPSDATLGTSPMVDMGVDPSKKAGRFGVAIGRVGSHVLNLELSALQAEGKGEIVSSPRLITANQKEAYIEQGIEIPYAEASSSGAATVAFKKAVLSLKVTPQITPDDRIILQLNVKKDSADLTTSIGASQNVAINTREISTQVLVNNGETIVLGGIYEAQKDKKVNRVPLLSKIPLVGVLFRDKSVIDNKSELLIFVTPKIIKDQFGKTVR